VPIYRSQKNRTQRLIPEPSVGEKGRPLLRQVWRGFIALDEETPQPELLHCRSQKICLSEVKGELSPPCYYIPGRRICQQHRQPPPLLRRPASSKAVSSAEGAEVVLCPFSSPWQLVLREIRNCLMRHQSLFLWLWDQWRVFQRCWSLLARAPWGLARNWILGGPLRLGPRQRCFAGRDGEAAGWEGGVRPSSLPGALRRGRPSLHGSLPAAGALRSGHLASAGCQLCAASLKQRLYLFFFIILTSR